MKKNAVTKNPVKIAHISTVDASLYGLLLDQMHYLQRAGFHVTGVSAPGPDVARLRAAGIRHLSVPMTRNFTPGDDLHSLSRLFRLLRRERFSIVHTHTPKAGLLGQLAARMAGVPIVVNTVHGFYFHDNMSPAWRRFYITTEKIGARCSDLIISVNREDIETAVREGICPPQKIRQLGNGIGIDLTQFDPARFSEEEVLRRKSELGIAPDAPVVGFVGRLAARRKGFLDFLAAAQKISAQLPAARFLIAGDADRGKPDAVEPEVANEYGIADRCIFLGHRPKAELPLFHHLMDVLVLPSLFEGVPCAVMEACAMSTPAVVTDVKGNREAVREDYNGHLVPLGDVAALSSAILSILSDPAKARRMGENGRAFALEQFDQQLVFQRVLSEYQRLLEEKGLPLPASRDESTQGIGV